MRTAEGEAATRAMTRRMLLNFKQRQCRSDSPIQRFLEGSRHDILRRVKRPFSCWVWNNQNHSQTHQTHRLYLTTSSSSQSKQQPRCKHKPTIPPTSTQPLPSISPPSLTLLASTPHDPYPPSTPNPITTPPIPFGINIRPRWPISDPYSMPQRLSRLGPFLRGGHGFLASPGQISPIDMAVIRCWTR